MSRNPAKSESDKIIQNIEQQMNHFRIKYHSLYSNYNKDKLTQMFELSSYHAILSWYEENGWSLKPKLFGKEFRCLLGTQGYPENFSYYIIKKTFGDNHDVEYYVRQNARIKNADMPDIAFIPDIIITNPVESSRERYDYWYKNTQDYCFFPSYDVISFHEAKNMAPFPELVVNFVGMLECCGLYVRNKELEEQQFEENDKLLDEALDRMLNEAPDSDFADQEAPALPIYHIAPSLICGGVSNKIVENTCNSIKLRYRCNYFFSLHTWYSITGDIQVLDLG